jgi:uncharacterized protein (TIRG00374 family)
MWKRIAAFVGSLIVSGLFLWIALRDVPVAQVLESLQQANPWWALVGLVIGVGGIYTRAIRWRGLVDNRISTSRAYYIVGIMQLMNLLPLRLGEVARTVLAAREKLPIVTTASSIVVERLLDMVFVLIMLAAVLTQVDTLPNAESVQASIITFSALSVIAFVVLLAFARYPNTARNVLHFFTERLTFLQRLPLEKILDDLLMGLKPLTDWGRFAHAVFWTIISWIASYLVFYTSQLALGFPATQLYMPALGLSLAAFSVALPLTVAALGPFQIALRAAGQAFAFGEEISLALGFLVHGVTIGMYIVTGVWGFLGMGVALTDVIEAEEGETTA